ncbi:EamA family transporter [Saccharopolyspora sp. K220]|uniref:EamA family transporter n=1 Tax=Saccharopolyspora soli TaxID=2926618 RepID=UPI001F57406C|nr:EamA family transporter [Saccharopolyspora soli]MCI2423676.1 EamA family transporter [Saccharopolyspora soli]
MTSRDRLLAVLVAVLWGGNFIAIDFGLGHFPPLFFAGFRFAVLVVPTLLFVPRPQVEWKWLLGYGLFFGTLQFAFVFVAMHIGMPTGLTSLVQQASAPFTVLLGALLLRERITRLQIIGILVAVLGMVVIGWHRAQTAALLPMLVTLCGAFSWALGNLCSRKANPPNPLHLALWISIVPPLPMFALSALVEGPAAGWQAVASVVDSPTGWYALGGLLYTSLLATVVGSGLWTTLLRRYPASMVAPFSLLVPVVGFSTAWLVLGEQPHPVELAAGAVVVGGVLLGSLNRTRRTSQRPVEGAASEGTSLAGSGEALAISREIGTSVASPPQFEDRP